MLNRLEPHVQLDFSSSSKGKPPADMGQGSARVFLRISFSKVQQVMSEKSATGDTVLPSAEQSN